MTLQQAALLSWGGTFLHLKHELDSAKKARFGGRFCVWIVMDSLARACDRAYPPTTTNPHKTN
jgi:hypothetical protein